MERMKHILQLLIKLLPTNIAYAHCDVPCGIYDPKGAQTAAATVLKMVQKIMELDKSEATLDDRNNLIRSVMTKEEHAQICKEEILILWTDYFKPEHVEKFPTLHEMFWKTAKLCSENKQHVSTESAEALIKAVDHIADVFTQSKQAK